MRTTPKREILWGQRSAAMPFLSGFFSFPGGKVEDGDHRDSVEEIEICRRAAIRETLEEVGLDLKLATLRHIHSEVAPPYLVWTLTTHYFLTVDPKVSLTPTVNDGEFESVEWISPNDALARWRRDQVLLAPPTVKILHILAGDALPDGADQTAANTSDQVGSQVRSDILLLPMKTPTLPPATHTNTYVIGRRDLMVVEPAPKNSGELEQLFGYLDCRIHKGAKPRAILLTHHHHDHIGGVEKTALRYGIPVWAHAETASRVPFEIDRILEDGETFILDEDKWHCIFTPGHAPGHLCFFNERHRSMIVGDMVAGVGSILVEPNDGDMSQYLDSLAAMKTWKPSCLLPSHGPVIGGAHEKLSQYIQHRLQRETVLMQALTEGLTTLEELVNFVYREVPKRLRSGPGGGLAGLSLRSHLNKLVAEGRAENDEGNWRLTAG